MADEIITTQQAAEILGITQEAVARLLRIGKIKGQKLGRDWAVSRTSVEEYQQLTTAKGKFDPTRGQKSLLQLTEDTFHDKFKDILHTQDKITDLVSTEEAALILGITRQSMGWLLRNGRIKAQKVGRNWVIEKDSVLEYKQEREKYLTETGTNKVE